MNDRQRWGVSLTEEPVWGRPGPPARKSRLLVVAATAPIGAVERGGRNIALLNVGRLAQPLAPPTSDF
jgi:hypothetical protein